LTAYRSEPKTTLFPYTTLFRSKEGRAAARSAPGFLEENTKLGTDTYSQIEDWVRQRKYPPEVLENPRLLSKADFAATWLKTSRTDRKSTRLNSSHRTISYAVFC